MACYSPNEDIVESALTCLTDITTQEYEKVQQYFT